MRSESLLEDIPMATKWSDLTPDLQERVAQHLAGNEVACTLRLLNKAGAELFRYAAKVRLSEPVPPHAFIWRWGSPAACRSLTFRYRQQLLALTAATGVLSNLQVAVAAAGCSPTETVFTSAAAHGHLHICEWLAEQDCPGCNEAVEAAIGNGHITLMRWFLSRWPTAKEWAWRTAAHAGRQDVCEALQAEGSLHFMVLQMAAFGAARSGHVGLVQWLLSLAPELDDKLLEYKFLNQLVCRAAYGCGLVGLQHVYDTLLRVGLQLPAGFDFPILAALNGPTRDWRAKVDWLLARGCALNERTVNNSMRFKLTDTLQPSDCMERAQLYIQLLPLGAHADAVWQILRSGLELAAPELVDFALELRPHAQLADLVLRVPDGIDVDYPTAEMYELLATPAHVVVAARLAARGVPVWLMVVKAAIRTCNLHVLQWMAAGAEAAGSEGSAVPGAHMGELDGLGLEVRAAAEAALRAALENSGMDLARIAAETGNLELMTWLRAQGCAWDRRAITKAAQAGNIELLEWMVQEGCPLPATSDCYELAIINQDMAVLQCLRRLGCPWGPGERELLGLGIRNGCRVELLAWLLEEGCSVDWEEARRAAAAREGGISEAVRAFIEESAP